MTGPVDKVCNLNTVFGVVHRLFSDNLQLHADLQSKKPAHAPVVLLPGVQGTAPSVIHNCLLLLLLLMLMLLLFSKVTRCRFTWRQSTAS